MDILSSVIRFLFRSNMRLCEFQLPKNKWELLISSEDKHELGYELIDLVRHAYSTTPQGSFVHSIRDVIPSDWKVIDWDHDPDVDATVFFRRNRPGETWVGYKIQGLGHDGQRTSKDKAIEQIHRMLDKPGWWMESSDAMQNVMRKVGRVAVTDEAFLQKLFNDPKLRMVSADSYTRVLTNNTRIHETVFGNPILKKD